MKTVIFKRIQSIRLKLSTIWFLNKFSVFRNFALNFWANVAIGIPSVFALYVADSVLTREDLSTFIKVWALTNTLIVGVASPLLTYAPNLRMDFKNETAQFDQHFFPVSLLSSLLIIIPIEFVVVYWMFDIKSLFVLIALTTFTVFSISFNIKNALLISKSAYGKYFFSACTFGTIASISLLLVKFMDFQSIAILFYLFSFALGAASADQLLSFVSDFSLTNFQMFVTRILRMKAFTPFLVTIFITSSSTFILNGPLLFGSFIGASNNQLVTFGTCLNIVLVCYTMLNSFTSPIQTSLISSLKQPDNVHFGLIYRKSFNSYLLFTLLLTVFLSVTINFLARIYVPSVLRLDFIIRLILVAGLGFSTLAGLPRLGLMISKRYSHLFFIWCAGLVSFVFVVFLPIDPFTAMVLAPTIASFSILVASTTTFRNTKISIIPDSSSINHNH
jgi:hypothetical protein